MNDGDGRRPLAPELGTERRFWLRVGGLTLAASLAWVVWLIVAPLWRPLVWAALFGALLAPWNARLTRRLGGRKILASSITLAVTVLLFVLPLAVVAGTVAAQASQLASRLDKYVPDGGTGPQLDLSRVPVLARPLDWIGDHTGVSLQQIETWLVAGTQKLLQALVSSQRRRGAGRGRHHRELLLMLFVFLH
jgi:predicted PurR-regulated permease PerM